MPLPNKNRPKGIMLSGRFFNLAINALSLGHLTSSQDLLECVLVQHGYAQLLGFGELGARFGAGDQVARLFLHVARILSAEHLERRARLVARAVDERAGEHEGQTRERLCVGELARHAGVGCGLRVRGAQVDLE